MQETWLLSEFCDKGNLDRALSGGRFHDKATGKPEMVMLHALCLQYAEHVAVSISTLAWWGRVSKRAQD